MGTSGHHGSEETAAQTSSAAAIRQPFRRWAGDGARQLDGNAVLGVRFDSSDLGNGLAEIVAYGTAATVRPA